MKQVVLPFAFCLSVIQCFSQLRTDSVQSKIYFSNKSESQKIGGVFLVAGGLVLTVVGLKRTTKDDGTLSGSTGNLLVGIPITVAGVGIGSYGFWLLSEAGKNKRKAATFGFKNSRYLIPTTNGVAVRVQPTITLGIPIGRVTSLKSTVPIVSSND